MERKFSVKGILCLAMAMASVIILPSCGDDDDNTPNPTDPKQIAGDYKGEMLFAAEGVTTPPDTVAIEKSVVSADTITFAKFPVAALITSIVGEVAAEPIIKAVGDLEYKIGYVVDAAASTDSTLAMKLDPKPLEIIFSLGEGAKKDTVTVGISGNKSVYGIKDKDLTFKVKADKFSMNGQDLSAIVKPLDLTFDLKK